MASFIVACEILIGSYRFTQVHEVAVKASWRELVDTCAIKLPNLKNRLDIANRFQPGDPVEVWLSYEGKARYKEFSGFVRRVKPTVPVEIECEDAMYLLSQINLVESFQTTSLRELLEYTVSESNKANPDYPITLSASIPDLRFNTFRLNNVSGTGALRKFKEQYGLVAYMRERTLYAGLAYQESLGNVYYSFAWNILDNPDLTYRRDDDVRVKVKATSILPDNKHFETEVGDEDGELRTLFFYNIQSEATLKKLAEEEIKKLKFEGFEGNFETFLIPFAAPGMVAVIEDPDYNNRSGRYMIDEVETVMRPSGIRRKVTIGIKVA